MSFNNARIALLEARMSSEMADLIRRHGGSDPIRVPAVRETARDCTPEVAAFIDKLHTGTISIVVFFTGVGAKALFDEAEKIHRQDELLADLRTATVVCRGPKPSAVLRRFDIPIAANAVEPYTTSELIDALASLEVAGKTVGVVHYGEYNAQIAEALQARGAELVELRLYEWQLPEDTQPLYTLVQTLLKGEIDAVLFTSQVQVRHLMQIAQELNVRNELSDALNRRTVVASIGPTCTAVLQEYGIAPHVIPEHPKMGHLVKALAEYMA